jgi:hypothetical protein
MTAVRFTHRRERFMQITINADWQSYESAAFPAKRIQVGALVGEVQQPDRQGRVDWEVYLDAYAGGFYASGTTDSIADSVTAAESSIAEFYAPQGVTA